MHPPGESSPNLAVLVDYDNVPLVTAAIDQLMSELTSRGRLAIRRAYGDWGNYSAIKQRLARSAFELVELPIGTRGKNCGDIRIAVDAMEIALTRDFIDGFVIVSGDRDFQPLFSTLRALGKRVIIVARRHSVGASLAEYSDDLILLGGSEPDADDAPAEPPQCKTPAKPSVDIDHRLVKARKLVVAAVQRLEARGAKATLSLLKAEIEAANPNFRQKAYGYSKFKKFVEAVAADGTLRLVATGKGPTTVNLTRAAARPVNPPEKTTEQPRSQPTARPTDSPAETPKADPQPRLDNDLLDRIYWARALRLRNLEEPISLARLVGALHKLYPHLSPTDYGFRLRGGFLRIAQAMEAEGWCSIEPGAGKSQYLLSFARCFFERAIEIEQPAQVREVPAASDSDDGDILPFHQPDPGVKDKRDGYLPF